MSQSVWFETGLVTIAPSFVRGMWGPGLERCEAVGWVTRLVEEGVVPIVVVVPADKSLPWDLNVGATRFMRTWNEFVHMNNLVGYDGTQLVDFHETGRQAR